MPKEIRKPKKGDVKTTVNDAAHAVKTEVKDAPQDAKNEKDGKNKRPGKK